MIVQLSMPCSMAPAGAPCSRLTRRSKPRRSGAPAAEKSGQDSPALQAGPSTSTKSLAPCLSVRRFGLSAGARLRLGPDAIVQLTGLRNPCYQIEDFRKGLLAAVLDRGQDGSLIRKAGVMCTVIAGGVVRAGDAIVIVHEPLQRAPLQPV